MEQTRNGKRMFLSPRAPYKLKNKRELRFSRFASCRLAKKLKETLCNRSRSEHDLYHMTETKVFS